MKKYRRYILKSAMVDKLVGEFDAIFVEDPWEWVFPAKTKRHADGRIEMIPLTWPSEAFVPSMSDLKDWKDHVDYEIDAAGRRIDG